MIDYFRTGHLDQEQMNPEYREAEEAFREQAKRLWAQNQELKKSVRFNLDLTPEERLDEYMRRYQEEIEPVFAKLASDFVGQIASPRGEDERLLQQGTGERFADYLVSLADKADEQLPTIMQTARRTGQQDLVRAVAQVALDRNQFGLFNEWAQTEPERAAALQRIRTTPDSEQLATRTKAMLPPRALPESLQPTAADIERVRQAELSKRAAERAQRNGFYGVRRMVGRYSEVI